MADRLRGLWNFADLDASQARLLEQLEREAGGAGRAEVLTQLARVEGLRGSFDEGERLLTEAETQAAGSTVVRARVDLERGRLLRSAGDPGAALPLFEQAFRYLGWHQVEKGEPKQALATFRRALEARERDPANLEQIEIARYAVAKALRLVGRPAEGAALLEQTVAWTERAGKPDGYFHEELAECYAALGRDEEAREHVALARSLLVGQSA